MHVLQSVIVEVDVVLHQLTGDIFPINAGINRVGNALVQSLARHRPSSLSDPNRFALGGLDCGVVRIEEELACAADAIRHG